MGILSDRAVRILAVVIAGSGWVVAMVVAGRSSAQPSAPMRATGTATPAQVPPVRVSLFDLPAKVRPGTSPARPVPSLSKPSPTRSLSPPGAPSPDATSPDASGVAAPPRFRAADPAFTGPGGVALVGVTELGDRLTAWLVDLSSHERRDVSVGDAAFGYVVKSIQAESVVLTQQGKDTELRFGQSDIQLIRDRRAESPSVPGEPDRPRRRQQASPVTVTTVVNVYPPEGVAPAAEARWEEDARSRPRGWVAPPTVTIEAPLVLRPGRTNRTFGSQPRPFRTNGITNPQTVRRLGTAFAPTAAGSPPMGDDDLGPEPIVNPQTVRRLGVGGASGRPSVGGYGTYRPYEGVAGSRPRGESRR